MQTFFFKELYFTKKKNFDIKNKDNKISQGRGNSLRSTNCFCVLASCNLRTSILNTNFIFYLNILLKSHYRIIQFRLTRAHVFKLNFNNFRGLSSSLLYTKISTNLFIYSFGIHLIFSQESSLCVYSWKFSPHASGIFGQNVEQKHKNLPSACFQGARLDKWSSWQGNYETINNKEKGKKQ